MARSYDVTALQLTIRFNREGDHDHNGLIYALSRNVPLLKYIRALGSVRQEDETKPPADPVPGAAEAKAIADDLEVPFPTTPEEAKRPHPLVRPLVLRTNRADPVKVRLRNEIEGRSIGLHLVGDGYDVESGDGSWVGANPPSLVPPGGSRVYRWAAAHEGIFPFHDGGDYSGGEDGTNVHGLFGALIVEPEGAIWRDPVSGDRSDQVEELDGLYLDVIPPEALAAAPIPIPATIDGHKFEKPREYHDFNREAHREFVIFFHDEPEFVPPHAERQRDPCEKDGGHGGGHGHGDMHLPIMPVSYRAEPMVNREQILFKLINEGHDFKNRPVLNEEQHHSSWMFGDPATPILRAYIGDPVRIRFVHAAVKETHVFHLHLYEWHAVPEDRDSPRIDAISVSPQTAHTIEPVWGAGNRHQVAGDVIWHCHLYPHFHEGMWGMFRTFETLQEGLEEGPLLEPNEGVYAGRRIGRYPDGTRIEKLLVLPGRQPPPRPTATHPGFPLYIAGEMKQKSPVPPWPLDDGMPPDLDYRPDPTALERAAFNEEPVPGEMFTRHRFKVGQDDQWNHRPHHPADPPPDPTVPYCRNTGQERDHPIVVVRRRIDYNGYGWHDKDGHLYYLEADGEPADGGRKEPLFFRAQHGQILNLPLRNDLPEAIEETEFDHRFPPCDDRPWQGECSLHVHMVKFDPICADGASVGWNYMSGPTFGKRMIYRWWLDQEFGSIFFHDHLFANYRQKHGLFGALIVEPAGAEFRHPRDDREIISGLQARISVPAPTPSSFREFCIAIGDFIPMWDRNGAPLNPPEHPGGHGDQGVMALNYRSDPIRERLKGPGGEEHVDPALWFTSGEPYNRDPYTVRFDTFPDDPIRFRVIQGSHEEQHSFQVHGLRWRRFRANLGSAIRNQQTFGIAEAFTFVHDERYGPGDYMYKLSSSDDLWLGCWGLVRAYGPDEDSGRLLPLDPPPVPVGPLPPACLPEGPEEDPFEPIAGVRKFFVTARARRLVYRQPDLIDPFGLVYILTDIIGPNGRVKVRQSRVLGAEEPLVLRCREGEVVRVYLRSGLPELRPEPFAPQVPVEKRNPFTHRPDRRVSRQVSMHADLLLYDVRSSDGATVGRNPRQTVAPGEDHRVYCWHTHRPSADSNGGEPLGPLLLQDMADFRNHRHHGLIGMLIVEPRDSRPLYVPPGWSSAFPFGFWREAWDGPRATVLQLGKFGFGRRVEERALLLQDGLRHFLFGNVHMPISDEPPSPGEDDVDHEDQGQKGFNYRSEPIERRINNPNPATPIFRVRSGSEVRLQLVGATDKPRNQSFTIHGVVWPEWRFLDDGARPLVASESAITTGTARTFGFRVGARGDYAYRSGVLKWAVPQGLWGILRVRGWFF
jgi:FtsP/CotA-like multicopper oxidase with cupredoxin domain